MGEMTDDISTEWWEPDNEGNVLFDPTVYGEVQPPRRHREAALEAAVEPYQPPWVLLANRMGVIGFHWPESVSEYSTTHALCGVKGHAVVPPETMVRCSECERLRLLT